MFKRIVGDRVIVQGLDDEDLAKLDEANFDSMLCIGKIIACGNISDLEIAIGNIILFDDGKTLSYGEDIFSIVNYKDVYCIL